MVWLLARWLAQADPIPLENEYVRVARNRLVRLPSVTATGRRREGALQFPRNPLFRARRDG